MGKELTAKDVGFNWEDVGLPHDEIRRFVFLDAPCVLVLTAGEEKEKQDQDFKYYVTALPLEILDERGDAFRTALEHTQGNTYAAKRAVILLAGLTIGKELMKEGLPRGKNGIRSKQLPTKFCFVLDTFVSEQPKNSNFLERMAKGEVKSVGDLPGSYSAIFLSSFDARHSHYSVSIPYEGSGVDRKFFWDKAKFFKGRQFDVLKDNPNIYGDRPMEEVFIRGYLDGLSSDIMTMVCNSVNTSKT